MAKKKKKQRPVYKKGGSNRTMNKKAQGNLGMAIMASIMIFLVGMMLVNFLKPEITRARGATNLNCAALGGNDTISDGTKVTCLVVDIVVPYFFVIIFSVAGGLITHRFIFSGK